MAAALALGCAPSGSDPERAPPSASAAPASGADARPWYDRARTLDLTADGRADSVRLEASGDEVDSLRIALVFRVDGAEAYREEWGSSYELALVDSTARPRSGWDELLRARLDSVLASVTVQRMGTRGARLMAEDSAALQGLDPRPTHQVSFAYGYETTVRLVWDASRRRFVRLWTCC